MAKDYIHSFAINLANSIKVKKPTKQISGKLGKKCNAVVIKENDKLVAKLTSFPVEDNESISEFKVLPFTDESFILKGKIDVFRKNKDKYGHYVRIIRDNLTAQVSPGLTTQYNTLHEGLKISGHVVLRNNKHYFNYESINDYIEQDDSINELLK